MQDYGKYLSFGLQLVVLLCMGVFGGLYVDRKYGHSPWGVLGGFIIALAVIVYNFVVLVKDLENKEKEHGSDQK
jgi:F0F1-type ATP synthase assembly protein I